MDSAQGFGPKIEIKDLETEEQILTYESRVKQEQMYALPHKDFIRIAYEKLEQLKKHTKLRMTLEDDFDDLDFGDEDDEDDGFGKSDEDDE